MKDNLKIKRQKLAMRHRRIRGKIKGTSKRPRLLVFRSHQHIYSQLIDDEKSKTLVSAKDSEIKSRKMKKIELAKEVGKLLAKKAADLKIKEVVFDRRGCKFHGRIRELAQGAKEGGLKF
ncbi:MAG: 50S ribosomal protein L18 [Candidatus Portnoybacteria bacterium RBG_19FT_COMBO_36_7]|uniref:Large ribosomal subunit protein uL18 n=1 Tax=Candidatus Portnoybacteria bacterium RBG_19FT_COMBO_36_7 TaxID=1801992 RepID=A0A1G2F7Y6_9BACT|nr:MAG: 50S ribosomal protein L18 [Candidatus Portnoybacteria bacterium RBG_19FT_COMBO_36_7]